MLFPTTRHVWALFWVLVFSIDTILSAAIGQPVTNVASLMPQKFNHGSRYRRNTRESGEERKGRYWNQRDVLMHLVINEESQPMTPDPDTPMAFWEESSDKFTKRQQFAEYNKTEGTVTLNRSGFYLAYADVQIINPTKSTGIYWYTIKINGKDFLGCMRSKHFWTSEIPPCRTSGGVYLVAGQKVTIHSKQEGRQVNPKSFWGLIRIKKGRGFMKKRFGFRKSL